MERDAEKAGSRLFRVGGVFCTKSRRYGQPGQIPKKLIDFFDQNLLRSFDLARFLSMARVLAIGKRARGL
jgi:hypothetical protein